MKRWVRIEGGKGKYNILCVVLSVSVVHVLWECPTYGSCGVTFVASLE